jgi:hypothetical protein
VKAFIRRDRLAREAEEERLAPAATRSRNSRGRVRPEEPDEFRTAFERDRDRILHSKAFRRLKHKTQVFINPDGDHFLTRLTHTLQVTQIARALAAALSLNETLAEAIARPGWSRPRPNGRRSTRLSRMRSWIRTGAPLRRSQRSWRRCSHLAARRAAPGSRSRHGLADLWVRLARPLEGGTHPNAEPQ